MAWAFPTTLANWQNSKKPRSAPPLRLLARESVSFGYMRTTSMFGAAVPLAIAGNGRHVMVLPGFMASDHTTARLRRSLEAAGFVAHGWGLGRNRGIKADIFERLDAQIRPEGDYDIYDYRSPDDTRRDEEVQAAMTQRRLAPPATAAK